MKGRLLLSLFALPFFGVGVWMLWSVSSTFVDAWQMRDWVAVDATLSAAGYETRSGDDSDTHEAYAQYSYTYLGDRYGGSRVNLGSGGDNIGDYQTDTGRYLRTALAEQRTITVYVDPENPGDSIFDRRIRWGLIGFKSIFLFVFGGVGLGLLIAAWRASDEKDKSLPEYQRSPWLLNDDWQTPTIRSSSKSAMWGAWFFAAIWNLISAVTPFLAYREVVENGNTIALVALLFPLIGIGLLVWAIRRTLEWRRFGPSLLTLDPFPGSIGGDVGGIIDLDLPFDPSGRFQMTLTSIHSYMSGSGKSRSRREKARWQDVRIAHAEPGGKGTRLSFRFDVPEGLDASDPDSSGDSYHLWRLNLAAELPGTDLDRDYELPVFATATRSGSLPDHAMQIAQSELDAVTEQKLRELVRFRYTATGKQLLFPMGRNPGATLGGFIVGAIFAGVGWYLIAREGHAVFGSVFGGIGGLIGIFCLYMLLNSLEVLQQDTSIVSIRRLLGIPISRKRMQRHQFVRFDKSSNFQTRSGGKHVVHYSVYAVGSGGERMIVGEGFKGKSETDAVMRFIAREFGLRWETGRAATRDDDRSFGSDVLTADH